MFGILTVNQNSSVFAWIFTVLNSLQVRHVKYNTLTLIHYPIIVKLPMYVIYTIHTYTIMYCIVISEAIW